MEDEDKGVEINANLFNMDYDEYVEQVKDQIENSSDDSDEELEEKYGM